MRHFRRAFPITIGLAAATASVLLACSDDDTSVTPTPDAATQDANRTDTGTPTDSGGGTDTGSDTGVDSGVDTGADAGPTLTAVTGAVGEISIANDAIIGVFYEDDTILHWSNATDCVAFVRGPTKPNSPAATLTVGGQIVGTDGGTDQTITVDADPNAGNLYFFFGPVYPSVDTFTVDVQLATSTTFAAMPVQTMRPPRAAAVPITLPPAPDASTPIGIPTTAPFVITWTAPTGGFVNDQKMSVRLQVLTSSAATAKLTNLYCAFPLNLGTATIPANVLAELKTRAGGPADVKLHAWAGAAKEVKVATGSYFVEVVRPDTTVLAEVDAKLQ